MPINRDGDGPPLRREDAKSPPPRADDLRATPFTDDVFDDDYYGRRRSGRGSSLGLIAAVVVGAVVAASIGWYVFGTREPSIVSDGGGNSKLVKADPTPYKVKPDDPGGMQVDNQDKLVYERLDKGAPAKRVENLLPEPEQPKAPPLKKADAPAENPAAQAANSAPPATATASDDPLAKLVAKVEGVKNAPAADQPMTQAAPTAQAEKPAPSALGPMTPAAPSAAPPPVEQKVAALPPEPAQTPPAAMEAAPSVPAPTVATRQSAGQPLQLMPKQAETAAPVAEAPAAPPPTRVEPAPTSVATATPAPARAFVDPSIPKAVPPAAASGQGTMYLQLTSALSEDGAMSDWKRISGKNADVLGNLSPSVLPADLGDKGMRYRLRAGPMDKTTADSLCATLRSRSVDCLVRP